MPLTVSTNTRHRTKQEFVYRTLRDAIIRCDLKPGERLVIDDLARKLEVSAIPVREGLQLLQSEGLVVNVPHVGATVAPISRASIQDVFTVLEGLESVATRLVAEQANPTVLQTLTDLVDNMDRAVADNVAAEWAELNTQFHLTIGRSVELAMLQEMTERVLDRWDRVRRYFFRGVLSHRIEQAQAEHRALLAAMRTRDFDQLLTVVRQHNQNALASYLHYLKVHGDPD
jgi:DNA-binding GntR family transcriptional regulator